MSSPDLQVTKREHLLCPMLQRCLSYFQKMVWSSLFFSKTLLLGALPIITREHEMDVSSISSVSKPSPSPSRYHDACSHPVTTPSVSSCWSIFLQSQLPRLAPCAAAQTVALVQGNSGAQVRISSQAPGWKRWKRRRASGLATMSQTTARRAQDKASLQKHHQYFLGRQRRST